MVGCKCQRKTTKKWEKSFLSSKLVKVFRLLNQRIIVIERTKRIDLLPFQLRLASNGYEHTYAIFNYHILPLSLQSTKQTMDRK